MPICYMLGLHKIFRLSKYVETEVVGELVEEAYLPEHQGNAWSLCDVQRGLGGRGWDSRKP